MGEIVVQEFISLDGVIQAPGGEEEDLDGSFDLGGWQMRYDDERDGPFVLEWESRVAALLLGRRTYEIWAPYWGTASPDDDGPFGDMIRTYNRVTKYVASRTLTEGPWAETTIIGDDLAAQVAAITAEVDGEIRVWGSSALVRSLAEIDAVDEYRLMLHPIVLGRGKRLFEAGFPTTSLRLAESRALPSGITVQIYRRAGDA